MDKIRQKISDAIKFKPDTFDTWEWLCQSRNKLKDAIPPTAVLSVLRKRGDLSWKAEKFLLEVKDGQIILFAPQQAKIVRIYKQILKSL